MSKTPPRINDVLAGAAFLMATSAIGPGFLTQTTLFTAQNKASFGFAILMSVLLDIGAQLNIWRIVALHQKRAPEIASLVLPGLGTALSLLIAFGGLAFNIGNIAGAGLGLNALAGIDTASGAALSAAIAIALFMVKEAGKAMDRFAQVLGLLMILLTAYVVYYARAPFGDALKYSFMPQEINVLSIITLVGGTVGGYITFAGAHRLLDAGISGPENIAAVSRSAVTAISLASVMRILLFLAALGVVYQGVTLDKDNPAASVFSYAAGPLGYRLFGFVLWSAAITSVVGSAYTSMSFLKSAIPALDRYEKPAIVGFILASTLTFVLAGKPVTLLVAAGALNGLILPVALACMLLSLRGRFPQYPLYLKVCGWMVALTMMGFVVFAALSQ
ncbi:MAG: divalent metal cation transporter [Bacteroidetes bacterium]|nr:MAG: divalent metal cation transporter [Bacteroidota bacterium]